jgi:hypothetical protein
VVAATERSKSVPQKSPAASSEGMERIFGTKSYDVIRHILKQADYVALEPSWSGSQILDLNFSMLADIGSKDLLEGLLAAQMVGTHNLAMQFLARAVLKDQTVDGVNMNVDRANKLLRTFALQMEALKRYRGKGEQRVIVKHVNVHEGGQAIVGAISHSGKGGGGGNERD